MTDVFNVTRSYSGTGDPVHYDGYFGAYVDGYSVVQTIDGYDQPVFFITADRAWKHRRALDKINIGVDQMKQLDGYDGYNGSLLQKLLGIQSNTRALVMGLDEAVDSMPYNRILTEQDIK